MKNEDSTKGTGKKVERIVNIALIITAILFVGLLVQKFFLRSGSSSTAQPVQVGAKLELSGMDWANNGQTLLLALSTTCRFCSESAPLYRRLVSGLAQNNDNTRVIAVFPQAVNEGQQYLKDLGVSVDEIRQAKLRSIGLTSVPTLIIVNNVGVVTDIWTGKLKVNDQFAVLDRLQLNDNALATDSSGPTRINVSSLKRAMDKKEPIVIVDVEDRNVYKADHIPGAVNIPFDELEARANDELSLTDTVVVYSRNNELSGDAANILINSNGFSRVSVLNGGLKQWKEVSKTPDAQSR